MANIRESMTYGILPDREDFDRAFEEECPNGYYISLGLSDSKALENFSLGNGCFSSSELWEGIREIIYSPIDNEDAMDFVGSIMNSLGFEWI